MRNKREKKKLHIVGYCRWCKSPILDTKNFIVPKEVNILLHKSCWERDKTDIIEEWGE